MKNQSEPINLKVFRGYTIDMKLREFRKTISDQTVEIIPFDSEEGQSLQKAFIRFGAEELRKLVNSLIEESADLVI